MTTVSWVLLGLTVVVALAEWFAVATERASWRPVTKPLSLVGLIGVALAVEPFDSGIRTVMVVGLVLSLLGDIFLLREKWFVYGLVSFLLGHVAYIVGLQMADRSLGWSAVGLLLVAIAAALVGRKVVGALRAGERPEMVGPVIAYVAIISAMVVSAFGTGSWLAIVGALLFYVSDGVLAVNRFVQKIPYGNLAVMTTYHLGQAGLTFWLVWP